MIIDKEIQALINLIDDPDQEIYEVVEKNLIDKGADVINQLEAAWEIAENEVSQYRIENIIHRIQFSEVKYDLQKWSKMEDPSLLAGSLIIARYQYPETDIEKFIESFEAIKRDIWLEINENLTALEKVKILNHIIFDIHQFHNNSDDFYAPSNAYINRVIETKTGNPIGLGILYATLAQELDIPIQGVNLPKNFILAYKDETDLSKFIDDLTDNVLFYINPYNKGSVFGRREIEYYIKHLKIEPNDSYFQPCSNVEIIRRLILTLIHSYDKSNDRDKMEDMKNLFALIKD